VHEQLAVGRVPVHGLPVGQVVRLMIVRQSAASRPQVATTVDDSQNVPCWFMHSVGGAPQEHEAVGNVPVQGFPTGHMTGVSL